MIRIQLSPEPQWFELGHGVRLQLLPLTTALMVATRSDPAVQALEAEANNDSRAATFAAALARRAIVNWEGVGDADGAVIAVTPEGIDALLSLWPIFEAFNLHYVSRGMLLDAEKNGSPPSPTGTSAGAIATARPARRTTPAEPNAKTAPRA
ncbi:hypothetical protein [Cypionkella sp. TWP1-2-1b2]|uniref:hypothetical protein n=1 Tax=Cypionkella sp. TWP1-2-1b2 TaxID=2804675 RepID=UPI003CEA75EF